MSVYSESYLGIGLRHNAFPISTLMKVVKEKTEL